LESPDEDDVTSLSGSEDEEKKAEADNLKKLKTGYRACLAEVSSRGAFCTAATI
jgi:hypothetical protein